MWRGNLCMSAALLTAQPTASVALTARLPPQIVQAPRAPHQPLQQRSAHVHPEPWPLLPGQCLSGCISGHFSPSQNHHPQVMKGKEGENRVPKGGSGCFRHPLPSPMPTNQHKQLPWARERQKSGAPESSEETSVRHMMVFFWMEEEEFEIPLLEEPEEGSFQDLSPDGSGGRTIF